MLDPENPPTESVGERLKRLRLERGLSQRELAAPGVSYAYISRIEAGARRPSVKALRLLAQKLGVSADYLETGSEIRDVEERELRLADSELELRFAEDPSDAEATLAAILGEARAAGDAVSAVRAQMALGLSAARHGREADAIGQLEAAIASGSVSPAAHPNVYATLGRAYASSGRSDRAVELFESCLGSVEAHGSDHLGARVRFTTYLANALTDLGEFERAQRIVQHLLDESEQLVDPQMRARLYWSLGRVVAHEGKAALGLDYLRRAIAVLEATEDTVQLARAHLMSAWILISAEQASEAGPHLELAERLLGPHAEPLDVAYLRTEQAKMSVLLRDGDDAVARARAALEVLGDSDPREQGGAWFALAQGLVLQGEAPAAEEAFRRATTLLEQHGQRRECGEALRAWARFLREQGRESEALDVLERATALGVPPTPAGARIRA